MVSMKQMKSKLVAELQIIGTSAVLEADMMIAAVCDIDRARCYADPDQELTAQQISQLNAFLQRRLSGEPLAYILEQQSFWSMSFEVTPATLIPRPDTECLVEWILVNNDRQAPLCLADLGTGSGVIAVAVASECRSWTVHATDVSADALAVAKRNARQHDVNVQFFQGDWCDALPSKKYDIIVSNPPYIEVDDHHLAALSHEPITALVSGDDGLDDLQVIVKQSHDRLIEGGCVVLEHGSTQADAVCQLLADSGFANISTHQDWSELPRFSVGYHSSY